MFDKDIEPTWHLIQIRQQMNLQWKRKSTTSLLLNGFCAFIISANIGYVNYKETYYTKVAGIISWMELE